MSNEEYSIQFVAKVTGINPHTIRAWEKRYQAIVPIRNTKNRRVYSSEHMEKLKILNDLVRMGNNISVVAKLPMNLLQTMHEKHFGQASQVADQPVNKPYLDLSSLLQNLIFALKAYKLDIIGHELEKARGVLDVRDFALNVLCPLLQEVAMMRDHGQINISQEHALSAILRFHIGSMLFNYNAPNKTVEHNIILTTPEGEMHEFGIMIAALLCRFYHLKFIYLGAATPAESLIECAKQIKSKYIILGVSRGMELGSAQFVANYLEQISQELDPRTKVYVGGFSVVPKIKSGICPIEFVNSLTMLDYKLSQIVS